VVPSFPWYENTYSTLPGILRTVKRSLLPVLRNKMEDGNDDNNT